jgi:flagellar biosynthetic protein FliR
MISVTTPELNAWLAMFMWPLARVLGLIAAAPLFSNSAVPATMKLVLGLAVTVAIAPMAGPMPDVSPASGAGLLILVGQSIVGATLGFAMRIAFAAADLAGDLCGLQMGLGFATFYDPQSAHNSAVLSEFFGVIATLLLLAGNGHLLMLGALAQSFQTIPVSASMLPATTLAQVADWGGLVFRYGLLLSLPLVVAMMIANLALGVLTKAAPQLNIFAVGFPLTIFSGFIVLWIGMPYFGPVLEQLPQLGIELMLGVHGPP